MRVMLTGAQGFVASYVLAAERLVTLKPIEWLLTSRNGGRTEDGRACQALDVTDADAVDKVVKAFAPTHVLHLAGITSLSAAAHDTRAAWDINVFGSLNIAHAMIARAPGSTLISVGTGLSYGDTARDGRLLTEDDCLRPQNTYSVTKSAADLAIGALAHQNVRMLRLRPFNHTGPGQIEKFVLPSFVGQIARIEAGLQPPVMRVGNLDVERDFLDVRDVAEAYLKALALSSSIPSGTILNISSGAGRTIRWILNEMTSQSTKAIEVEIDPTLVRANEIARFVGDCTRARTALNWTPKIDFRDTIQRMLGEARQSVG